MMVNLDLSLVFNSNESHTCLCGRDIKDIHFQGYFSQYQPLQVVVGPHSLAGLTSSMAFPANVL